MRFITILALAIAVVASAPIMATIINIPDDYPAIQQGIDASTDGDTVLVQPGTYAELISFSGHNVTVASLFLTSGDLSYITSTTIDAASSGTTVLFENGENETAAIIGFTITGGDGSFGGGISCASGSSPTIMHNIIIQNSASQGGGGISCWQNCHPLIANNIIYGNSSLSFGGGILCSTGCNPTIVNNVIIANVSSSQGGAIMSWQSNPQVINSICWANEGSGNDDEISGTVSITYSNIEGGWNGQGNMNADPLFRDPENGDFHLMSTACDDPDDSPCIDMGDPDIFDNPLNCDWGLGEERSDMGAYSGAEIAVDVDEPAFQLPRFFRLGQNYPNPFNASTRIRYELPEQAQVKLDIYDILGRKVTTIEEGMRPAGYHQVLWIADAVPSGIYFYRLKTGDYVDAKKMLLVK